MRTYLLNTKIYNSLYRKDARLPETLQRTMAAEAEASREARAKVIAADGEMRASKALREASNVIETSPAALQLRYLQVGCRLYPANAGGQIVRNIHCSLQSNIYCYKTSIAITS